jgi:hypothetical protein
MLLHATPIKRGLFLLPETCGCQADLYFPAKWLLSVYWLPLFNLATKQSNYPQYLLFYIPSRFNVKAWFIRAYLSVFRVHCETCI